jgi:fibronectin type 3 domain-containing protein
MNTNQPAKSLATKGQCFLLGLLTFLLAGGSNTVQAFPNEVYLSGGVYRWKINNIEQGSTADLATAINNCVWQSTGAGREIHIMAGGDLATTLGLPPDVKLFGHTNTFRFTHGGYGIHAKGVNNIGVYDMTLTNGMNMVFRITACNNVVLSGINISGGFIGMRVDSRESQPWTATSYNLTVTNCAFENLSSHGLETYGIDGVYVDGIVARNNGECGVLFNGSRNGYVGTVDAYRCSYGGGYAGLRFANGNANFRVKYLRAIECGRGFFTTTDAKNIIVEEVYIRDCTSHAILIQYSDEVGINSGTHDGFIINHYTSVNCWILATDATGVTNSPPTAPSPPTATVVAGGISLNWSGVSGATNYLLQRAATNTGPYQTIAFLETTNFVDRSINSNTTYYYVVRAVNAAGPSNISPPVSAGPVTPVVDVDSGLQLHFPFDVSGADSQGGPPAAIAGTPTYVAGLLNQALAFDGNANFATLPPLSSADFRDFTAAVWVWHSAETDWQRLFDFGNGTANYMMLTRVSGAIRFDICRNSTVQSVQVAAPPLGRWVHVAVTFSGNWATLYFNGTVQKSVLFGNNPVHVSLLQNYLGKSQFADPLFNGRLDDFRIYNRGLTTAEVLTLVMSAPPLPPFDLAAGAFGTRVNLQWAGVVNAATYNVKRAVVSGGPYTTIATGLTGTTYSDTNIATGANYYYVVTGSSTNGESVNSVEASAFVSELVARLRFDETSGTNAFDTSGNTWNGTLINNPTWTNGVLKRAVNLSGASQYVALPGGVVSGLNNFTVCAWVKVTSFNTWARIFDFGSGPTNYMFLTAQYDAATANAAKLRFAVRTPASAEQQINSSVAITSNTWVHVAVTLTNATGRIYINGMQVGINSSMSLKPSNLGNTLLNYLGKSQFNDPYFNGVIDDLRIYARALTGAELTALANPVAEAPDELKALADDGRATLIWEPGNAAASYVVKRATLSGGSYAVLAAGLTNTTFTDTGLTNGLTYYYVVSSVNGLGESGNSAEVSVIPDPLRLWLAFDESAGAIASDSSGNYLDGMLINNATFAPGREGNAVTLVSSNSQYATLPIGVVSGLSNFTIAAWVNLASTANWARLFDFGNNTTTYMFLAPQNGATGKLRFAITTNSTAGEQQINSGVSVPIGGWHHLAVTLSGTVGILYLDGVVVGTTSSMTLNPASLGTTSNNYLGKSQWSDPYLNGKIDDFQIYSTALTAGEVATFITPLLAPGNPVAVAGDGAVGLSWNAVSRANRYLVLRSPTDGGPYGQVAVVTSPSFTDLGLTNGMTYHYVVQAANSVAESPLSTQVTARPVSTTPPLLAMLVSSAGLDLTWPASHTGWRLQAQTNTLAVGLNTNWFDVPGTAATNWIAVPMGSLNRSVFYRLVYP